MKTIYLFLFGLLCLMGVSCTTNFDELNENPNSPPEVDPQYLLTNVITVEANANTYDQGFLLADYLAQFSASVEFERIDRYEMGSNSAYWDQIFLLLTDLKSMENLAGYNEAYGAVGDILKSFLFSQLTDMWGDVPYTEALEAKDGKFTPKYDNQESIYTAPETGILAVLQRSAVTLQNTNTSIAGDVMFNNDLGKWTRFANSLRLRYLLRISNRLTDFSEMQALADSGMLIESNEQNAVVPYLSAAPNQFPFFTAALGAYGEHRMTKTVDSVLKLWNDPRISILYKPTQLSVTNGNPQFKGLLNGQNRETISEKDVNLNDISLFGSIYRDVPDGVNGQYMQYAEVQFILAEAAARGYIAGNAQTYYQNAIAGNFNYYGTKVPDGYFEQEAVALTGNRDNDLVKILTQKWLSLITNGHEAWFNIRRTGIPALKPGPDNLNDGRYPARYLYPESEQATNSANYQEAVKRMGGDDINSKVWWEILP
ncbi:SusD/RagB family nutrient-binding outer membrane lipoprotein [Flavimarina sp. Hel_I_48]|uniref:SusD/RagB family nutrient-binding outer membrane lipoprotein n=1 Tax=Flavimarina sp. Hel_I_48 TaxID=1392488 RepID=UPI0004DF4558|nr:SusD/RagB family nutrient-binding outer membrane lipoprotein [Flavimarina sp. Hel_I_48]